MITKATRLEKKFVKACRDVAKDIRNGDTPGTDMLATEKDCPVCAVGWVAARCGLSPGAFYEDEPDDDEDTDVGHEAYGLFQLMGVDEGVIIHHNDNLHWTSTARALERFADRVEKRFESR